jgi:hypothetical protein
VDSGLLGVENRKVLLRILLEGLWAIRAAEADRPALEKDSKRGVDGVAGNWACGVLRSFRHGVTDRFQEGDFGFDVEGLTGFRTRSDQHQVGPLAGEEGEVRL